MMNEERIPLVDKAQTVSKIREIVRRYAADLHNVLINGVPASSLSLPEYFNFVRSIPYRRDPDKIEIVSRPYYILKNKELGMDCKKKSVLIASFLYVNNKPFRFMGSSVRPDGKIHHIFVQVRKDGKWLNVDATYPSYELFETKTGTAFEVL